MKTGILLVTDNLWNGGVSRVVYNIAAYVDKSKFDVYVYVLDDSSSSYRRPLKEAGAHISTAYPRMLRKSRMNKRVLLYVCMQRHLARHPNIKAVHVHCANQGPEILLAAKMADVPVRCMHAHVAYSKYWNPSSFSWKSKIFGWAFKLAYHLLATHELGCSQAACTSLFWPSGKQQVIFNGIDMEYFSTGRYASKLELQGKYNLKPSETQLIFVGRFCLQKNIFFLLESYKVLTTLNEHTHLSLVGYGEQEEEVRKSVTELGLEGQISFFPQDSTIPELLKAADYFICPSLYEGLGIVFVEAQLMGLTAFASDEVPREADLGRCEFIPLSLGTDGYAKYVHAYIQNDQCPPLDKQMLALYDMRKVAKQLEEIYLTDN